MKRYKQLDQEQRYTIEKMRNEGYSQISISEVIGVHRSTISRELRRNTPKRGRGANIYNGKNAHHKAIIREQAKPKAYRFTCWMLSYIRDQLKKEKWSPEFISAKGKEVYGDFVSHEAIYQYIWISKHSTHRHYRSDKDLHKHLRHFSRRKKRKNTKHNRGCIPNRTPMSERPAEVEKRTRIGDIEVDLMMGKDHKPGLIVLTDRTTLETHLIKTNSKKANDISDKIIRRLSRHKKTIRTLTFDNDLAFAQHEKIAKELDVKTYFTRPYTSQDKGIVENRIGVTRHFFPKGTDMTMVHYNTIKSVETKLNNRPVRKFKYLSPLQKKELINRVALVA